MITTFKGEHGWLSNFAPCEVLLDLEFYPNVEAAYQASKTVDKQQRKAIREAKTPGDAKRLGKQVALRPDWEQIKIMIMYDLLCQKFHSPGYAAKLLGTGSELLIEGNTWGDTFWGQCGGRGFNILGQLIMIIRNDMQE